MGEEHPRIRVLVVDDDPGFLEFVRDGLEPDMAVVAAHSPLEALWILDRDPVDVVVCDLLLGSTDGDHLLEMVRERWPLTARVLVTGYGDRLPSMDVSVAQAVVFKPVDTVELRELIRLLPDLSRTVTLGALYEMVIHTPRDQEVLVPATDPELGPYTSPICIARAEEEARCRSGYRKITGGEIDAMLGEAEDFSAAETPQTD